MNIGIVVYSKTGHTFEVASRLNEMFESTGHTSTIERVIPKDDKEYDVNKIELNEISDLSSYELIVFASPVNAFSLTPPMKKYMMSLNDISVPAICFVTMALPFKWMGGTQTVSKMKYYIKSSGGTVLNTGIIRWSGNHDEKVEQFLADVKREI